VLPYITVLPSNVFRININTASAVTLQSVTDKMSPSKAQSLVETERNYTTENSVFEEFPEFNESQDALAVNSEFFEVQVRVEINGGRVELTSLLHRDFQTGELTTLNRDYSKRFAGRRFEYDAETDTQN
jgi:type II secretory pathway component PulK